MDCETDKQDQKKILLSRLNQFDAHINSITRNLEDLNHLQAAGYSPLLWTKVLNLLQKVYFPITKVTVLIELLI